MTDRDRTKLSGCHPALVGKVEQVFAAMHCLGFTLMVTDGVRSAEQQRLLYAKGRTAPGPVVTNADGEQMRSNHQVRDVDGYGHAADCCFVDEHGPSWAATWPWNAFGYAAEAVGLIWGGHWHDLVDRPHLELP